MTLPLDVDRAATFGIASPYVPEDVYYIDPVTQQRTLNTSMALMPLKDLPSLIVDIRGYHTKRGIGYGGWGMDPQLLYYLYPSLFWFVGFMIIRYLCREPLARLGIYAGVVKENKQLLAEGKKGSRALTRKNFRKILKFQNQVWLSAFYILSTIYGLCMLHAMPWFGLPIDNDNAVHMVLPHPYNPPQELMTYYHYGLAFYFSEVMSLIFLESQMKRADFYEYVVHHTITIALIMLSHAGWDHRFGAYVLFIHDASDIMLCVAKTVHYIVEGGVTQEKQFLREHPGKVYEKSLLRRLIFNETVTNICFVLFIASFFFFRMYCLPMLGVASIGVSARLTHGNYTLWILMVLLQGALQALHIYWSALIVNMAVCLLRGGERKDIRSEEDEEEADVSVPAAKSEISQ